MIVLLPVSRFRVKYEVASGRPFSRFEHLILLAVEQGATQLEALKTTFSVHPRLIVEALVTLTHAGWLAVGDSPEIGFLLTAEGQEAVKGGGIPTTIITSARTTFVGLERMTGQIISNREVNFPSRRDLKDVLKDALMLHAKVTEGHLDEGQVQHFLPRQQGEWVRWVGPIDMISKDNHFLPVAVNLQTSGVVGIPDRWEPALKPLVLQAAERLGKEGTASGLHYSEHDLLPRSVRNANKFGHSKIDNANGWETSIDSADFLATTNEHESYLSDVLTSSDTSVFISSAFLNRESISHLLPLLRKALERGLRIDLLWGFETEKAGGQGTLDALGRLIYESKKEGLPGLLRVNRSPSHSHAKFVIRDMGDGIFEACVGSYNWFARSQVSDRDHASVPLDVSLRVNEPNAVAAICRYAAVLWSGVRSELLTSTADRWRRNAADLELRATSHSRRGTDSNARIKPLMDYGHIPAVSGFCEAKSDGLMVFGRRLGTAGITLVEHCIPQLKSKSSRLEIRYGTTDLSEAELSDLQALYSTTGIKFEQVSQLHTRLLLGTNRAIITSYDFLSKSLPGRASRSREVGIAIEGEAVSALAARIRS